MQSVNLWAVLVSAAAGFALGGVYYRARSGTPGPIRCAAG
jgi:hypothetical protein